MLSPSRSRQTSASSLRAAGKHSKQRHWKPSHLLALHISMWLLPFLPSAQRLLVRHKTEDRLTKSQQQREARRGRESARETHHGVRSNFSTGTKRENQSRPSGGMLNYLCISWRVIEHGRERWRRLASRDVRGEREERKHLESQDRQGRFFQIFGGVTGCPAVYGSYGIRAVFFSSCSSTKNDVKSLRLEDSRYHTTYTTVSRRGK